MANAAFEKYWEALKAKNSGLADDENKMTITVASFKRAMEQAFERGADDYKLVKERIDSAFDNFKFKKD